MLTFMPQKLIKLLTVAMSTVRMDTAWSSGKHVIQSILLTWKYLLANADVLLLKQEFQSRRASQWQPGIMMYKINCTKRTVINRYD